jgi:hypothetical protein
MAEEQKPDVWEDAPGARDVWTTLPVLTQFMGPLGGIAYLLTLLGLMDEAWHHLSGGMLLAVYAFLGWVTLPPMFFLWEIYAWSSHGRPNSRAMFVQWQETTGRLWATMSFLLGAYLAWKLKP